MGVELPLWKVENELGLGTSFTREFGADVHLSEWNFVRKPYGHLKCASSTNWAINLGSFCPVLFTYIFFQTHKCHNFFYCVDHLFILFLFFYCEVQFFSKLFVNYIKVFTFLKFLSNGPGFQNSKYCHKNSHMIFFAFTLI